VFLDERPRTDVCEQLGVDDSHFRVMLYRAKSQLPRRSQPPSVLVRAGFLLAASSFPIRSVPAIRTAG
jgi:hypothetical protein